MNRRSFLSLLGGAAVALGLEPVPEIEDLERRIWIPGKRKIFIPKQQGLVIYGPAAIDHIGLLSMPGAVIYRQSPDEPLFGMNCSYESASSWYAAPGNEIIIRAGSSVTIRPDVAGLDGNISARYTRGEQMFAIVKGREVQVN